MLTFQHLHSHSQRLVGLLLVHADGLGHDHLTEAALAQRFPQSQPETEAQWVSNHRRTEAFQNRQRRGRQTPPPYRERGNSHLGSEGSSSSETLARIGPSLEDSRAIRTSGVLEFMDELESKDTCLGAKDKTETIVIVSETTRKRLQHDFDRAEKAGCHPLKFL